MKSTKNMYFLVLAIIIFGAGAVTDQLFFHNASSYQDMNVVLNPKNATYTIDGREITLVNGVSVVTTTFGSASKITTKYFGNEAVGDVNNDGKEDAVFLLTQTTGGSGTFYYVVVDLANNHVTNAVFLGDRIAPQTTEIRGGEIIVNYADRKVGEPMTTQPSVGFSKYFTVNNEVLEEIKK